MRLKLVIVVAILAWAGVELHGQCAGPLYPGSGRAVARDGRELAQGDLNGDGHIDVVAVSHGLGDPIPLTVLLNDGAGGMEVAGTYLPGRESHSVVIGDLDGDGDQDLVVCNTADHDVSIFLNHGDGSFADQVRSAATTEPWKAALGDFDADGDLDMAVASFSGGSVSVLVNAGDASFAVGQVVETTGWGNWIEAGDLDADGDLDLVVTCSPSGGDLSVLLNDGNGGFAVDGEYDVGVRWVRMFRLHDIDADSDLDMVTVIPYGGVKVLRNRGDGKFDPAEEASRNSYLERISIADLDEDGDADILAVGRGGGVVFISNEQQLGFTEHEPWLHLPWWVTAAEIADFNNDGELDLAVLNSQEYDLESQVFFVTKNNDLSFQLHDGYHVREYLWRIDAADVDGESGLDLLLSDRDDYGGYVLLNQGAGVFGEPMLLQMDISNSGPFLADLDLDGDADLITNGEDGTVKIHDSNGDGTFAAPVDLPGLGSVVTLRVADFNDDGRADLVVYEEVGSVSVHLGAGDGTFQSHDQFDLEIDGDLLETGDVDGDGDSDIVAQWLDQDGFRVALNDGDLGFRLLPETIPTLAPPGQLVLCDFDGDGDSDVFYPSSTLVYFLEATGEGRFAPYLYWQLSFHVRSLCAGDVNNDGLMDLLGACSISDETGRSVPVLLARGDGTFDSSARFFTGQRTTAALAADVNGDGHNDLVALAEQRTGPSPIDLAVLLNRCPEVCVGDVNGDGETGQPDLGILLASYELSPDDPLFEPRADLNGDGAVGQADLGILLADYECGVARGN